MYTNRKVTQTINNSIKKLQRLLQPGGMACSIFVYCPYSFFREFLQHVYSQHTIICPGRPIEEDAASARDDAISHKYPILHSQFPPSLKGREEKNSPS